MLALLQQRNADALEQFAQFFQIQTVDTIHISHDHHFIEESIDRFTQLSQFDCMAIS